MKIINKKNNKIVIENLLIANNPISRIIGLLFKKRLNESEGLLILPCKSIHSYFMQFNFDAVFLDKENKIVHLIKNMPSWKVSPFVLSAHSVLELPAGIIDVNELELNDILEIIE